jgi:hypothetical protein
MKNILDPYTMRARLAPAILAGAPAFALAIALVSWGSFGLTHIIATIALTALFAAFSDVARRRGKAIEPALIAKMGGLASTTMLRHSDPTIDAATKRKIHAFIANKLSEPAPTAEEEAANPEMADLYYARGGTWLRENTRDAKKFSVLFNENVNYGFHRNLLGLRTPGFLLNAAIVILCVSVLWSRYPIDFSNTFNQKLVVVIFIAILHAAYLAIFVTETGVFEAARLYARQLLLASEAQSLNKPTPAAPRPRAVKPKKD